jgi:hypothetical protein
VDYAPVRRSQREGQATYTVGKVKVHISCDLWASPNTLAILGVVARFGTEDSQVEHYVIALKDIDSDHDGENLAAAAIQVVEDWGFASKLGYFVMGNAGN